MWSMEKGWQRLILLSPFFVAPEKSLERGRSDKEIGQTWLIIKIIQPANGELIAIKNIIWISAREGHPQLRDIQIWIISFT